MFSDKIWHTLWFLSVYGQYTLFDSGGMCIAMGIHTVPKIVEIVSDKIWRTLWSYSVNVQYTFLTAVECVAMVTAHCE